MIRAISGDREFEETPVFSWQILSKGPEWLVPTGCENLPVKSRCPAVPDYDRTRMALVTQGHASRGDRLRSRSPSGWVRAVTDYVTCDSSTAVRLPQCSDGVRLPPSRATAISKAPKLTADGDRL